MTQKNWGGEAPKEVKPRCQGSIVEIITENEFQHAGTTVHRCRLAEHTTDRCLCIHCGYGWTKDFTGERPA